MLQFDKFSIVVLLCAIIATLFLVNVDRVSVPVSPVLPGDSVGFAAHPLSSSFSSAEPGARVTGSQLSVSDSIVYYKGWYSINGSSWIPFNMSGSTYNGNINWLRGYASRYLPTFGLGEHYVLIYSCNRSNNAWDCYGNRLQLIVINNTGSSGSGSDGGSFDSGGDSSGNLCNVSIDCLSNEYCFNEVCLLNVSGHTYFVATNGNDAWPGNFTHPWRTWGKAFTAPLPGDIVYFRGGVYAMTVANGNGYTSINDGTSVNPIYYWAYPEDFDSGNVPILDCENITPSGDLNHGIYATADNVHFKGLTVRNVFQFDEADEAFGWRIAGFNTTIERCAAHNIHGVGFRAGTNSTNMRFINCDAYDIVDYLDEAPLPGNDGYGFQSQNTQTTTGSVYYYGCRAWNCSDDGFTLFSRSYVEIDNCWSFNNGALEGAGNGWKLGFLPDGGTYPELTRKVTNSIAAYNRASGFTSNDNSNEAVTMQSYNNIVYHNGYSSGYAGISPGFYLYNTAYPDAEELKRVLRNNLAHANEDGPVRIAEGALYTHSNNTWDSSLTLTDDDFMLLPETREQGFALLTAPRKADGRLPDLGNYFKLTEGSDLIDAGTVVSGYHCSGPGAHPSDGCREWYGSAPDLGPFESNYGTEVPVEDCGCADGYYCFHDTCLLNVTGHTYFVATNGNDSWPGNFTHPWKTWEKAFNSANAGDIVYFREGIYQASRGISASHSGNSINWIYYFNYPGEEPILDLASSSASWNVGITLNNIDYTYIKGLQVKNVKQRIGSPDLCVGVFVLESNYVKLEDLDISNIDGSGVYLSKNHHVEVINCDSYNNIDTYATDPGGWGMGFLVDGDASFTSGYVAFSGCRAWNCSDQGYGAGNVYSQVIFDNCWAYDNGALHGEGMGFKFGMPSQPSDNQVDISVNDCISAHNLGGGFDTNDGPYLLTNWLYNNFAYDNGATGNTVTAYGFLGFSGIGSVTDRIFKNNIAYQNILGPFMIYGGPYTEQYNSWNIPPDVTVNSEDFLSLDYSQLKSPRKADGSLPDITFGRLVEGSDLIDAGTIIPGYHCSGPGAHPGDGCREWYGAAPDLGPFEYSGGSGG